LSSAGQRKNGLANWRYSIGTAQYYCDDQLLSERFGIIEFQFELKLESGHLIITSVE